MKSQYAEQIRHCVTQWFPKHVAHFDPPRGSESPQDLRPRLLNWQKPGTSIYKVRYVIDGNALCVHGDVGEAVYRWSQVIDWDFLASCDLQYFVEKCDASEVGRSFVQWNARKLRKSIAEFVAENRPDVDKDEVDDLLRECLETNNAQEWMERAGGYTNILGSDYFEFADWGEELNTRAVGHWVGIQMATGNTESMMKRYELECPA